MEDVRKQDPTFTNFVPRTAAEAVDRYVRCRKNGLKPMLVPECLIACARGLNGEEMDRFEAWMINPAGDLAGVELVEQTSIRKANEKIFEENAERVERQVNGDELPPVPTYDPLPYTGYEEDDEKNEMMMRPPLVRQVSGDYLPDRLISPLSVVVTEPEILDPPPSSPHTLPSSSPADLCLPSSTSD